MAPFDVIIRAIALNTSSNPVPTSPTSSQPFSSSTGANDTIINIVFGILACIIGAITIWQAHRAWRIWHANHNSSIPRGGSHVQNGNNIPLPPYHETPYIVADEPRILSRMAAETMANRLRPSENAATSIPSERSSILLPRAEFVPVDGLTSPSANVENIEHAAGVVTEQQH